LGVGIHSVWLMLHFEKGGSAHALIHSAVVSDMIMNR